MSDFAKDTNVPTNDLISRQAAIKLAIELDYESRGILKESKCREIENRYNMLPSAQPERKKGKWMLVEYPNGYYHAECSECGEEFAEELYWHKKAHFCPNCGAEMRGEQE